MCSYKCWVWLTAIYSIPLILVLILGDVISLVGLNAPHLFQYTVPTTAPATAYLAADHLEYQNDEPRLGESAALRMAYESQFVRNLDGDNELANEEIQEITTKPTESAASSDGMTSSDQTSSETTAGIDSTTTESLNKDNGEFSEQPTREATKEPSKTLKPFREFSTESSASSSSEASTEPSQPSSEPGESSKASSESPTGSGESSTEPREPSTASSETSKASSETPSEPSEPSKPSSESSTEPSEPSKPSSESSTEPSEPSKPSSESSTEPSVGSSAPSEPSRASSEPSSAPSESTKAPVVPSRAPSESTKAPTEPSKAPTEPSKATSAPSRRPSLSSRRPSEPSPGDGGRGSTDRPKEGTTAGGSSNPADPGLTKRQTDALTSTTAGDKGELEPDNDKEDPNTEKPDDTQDKQPDGTDEKPEDPQGSREEHRSEVLKRSWNLFLDGIYANDRRVLLNVFVIIKICFRVLSLVTLPLLIIGNQKSRSTYVKPFKILLLLQFLFAIGITAYYAIAATECDYYKNIGDWLPRHFDDPTSETGKNVARLYLLLTFADLFPYFCIVSLILINKRDRQINRRKEESQQENWNIQLNPISLPRIKSTANSEHISPLNLHFNQTANDNLPMTAGLITNEEISVNNQPFSYTSNNNHQQSSSQLPCYDNHAFSKN